jgi:hypothetical protein
MSNDTRQSDDWSAELAEEPHDFFMTFATSPSGFAARADAALARHRTTATAGEAFDRLYRSTDNPYGTTLPRFRCHRRMYRGV